MPGSRFLLATCAAGLVALSSGAALAKRFDELDRRQQKELAEAARAYFEPEVEALWKPRKEFKAALDAASGQGVDPLKDLELIEDVAYQGRHFLPEFSERDWQKLNDIQDHKKSSVGTNAYNVVSERLRFTYSLPKDYKGGRALRAIPREAPRPLLVVLHDDQDYTGKDYPGEAVLERRWNKRAFSELYDSWFVLAPVAARAMFTETDRSIRHPFLTEVLSQFWRRYHVDFGRIVIDGAGDAAVVVAAQPWVYAGLVLRGGEIEPELVPNMASVPVFVVGDEKLEKALKDGGHPDVTRGEEKEAYAWLQQRRRVAPKAFKWTMTRTDHEIANWINLYKVDWSAPRRTLDVKVVDTPEDPNTIQIEAEGIYEIALFLNDRILDLDREVRIVVNGHETKAGRVERDFGWLFDKGMRIRENMFFAWLYPVRHPDVATRFLEIKPREKATPEETPPEEQPAETVTGSEADERTAARIWEKAAAAEADGDLETARQLYQSVIDIGTTSLKAKAEEKLATLSKQAASD